MVELEHYENNPEGFKKLHKIPVRTIVESQFCGNNVVHIGSVAEAYELARKCPGTIELTGMPIYKPEIQGLPKGANVLLFNDGGIVGRAAAARRIVGVPGVDTAELCKILREAVFQGRNRKFYEARTIIGLDKDFTVSARLMIPEGFENNLLSWILNFQFMTPEIAKFYKDSRVIPGEADVLVYSDPYWTHPDFPLGLAFFSPEQNCAAILGMRYFGEFKKGTLTLGWGTAARNGYASCHGGLKRFTKKDGKKFVLAVFGLSGSGKSTITHAKHNGKYDIVVLHDDAFVVNVKEKYAIAMEPTYFDKLQDYPMGCEDNKFLLTAQNCGATKTVDGKIVAVTEDVRNGNGRSVKSRLWSSNRVDRIDEPLDAICWIMKDSTLPPFLKLNGASLGAMMGATLATKRTSAEQLAKGVDPNALVVECYANPFRTYPLAMDYERFKKLLEDGVSCYVLNTGDFMGKKVPKEVTFSVIEAIVDGTAEFKPFGNLPGLEYLPVPGFDVNFDDASYVDALKKRMNDRLQFIESRDTFNGGVDKLPADAKKVISDIIAAL